MGDYFKERDFMTNESIQAMQDQGKDSAIINVKEKKSCLPLRLNVHMLRSFRL
jgi:hypothetical protein